MQLYGLCLETGEPEFFRLSDVLYIDLYEPKKNYSIPRFHTCDRSFTAFLTIDECHRAFGSSLLRLSRGNLINLKKVIFVTDNMKLLTAHFKGGKSCSVSYDHKLKVKHLIQNRK